MARKANYHLPAPSKKKRKLVPCLLKHFLRIICCFASKEKNQQTYTNEKTPVKNANEMAQRKS